MGSSLGDQLKAVRQVLGLSLKVAAERADISTAYLQKLEGGEVGQPSPHVLHRLAAVLDVPYAQLMELVGYIVPEAEGIAAGSPFDHALSSADLSADERKAVAAFIAHLRDQRK